MAGDPFPREIEIVRGRRRTVEMQLVHGRLQARVPMRARLEDLEPVLADLRARVWEHLRRNAVFDDQGLTERAQAVAYRHLFDFDLPPWRIRFSRRQKKRWGSCTYDRPVGDIRISAHLIGHPVWVLDAVILHELVHLIAPDHGEMFQGIVRDDPDHDRAMGYLSALEHLERLEPPVGWGLRVPWEDEAEADDDADGVSEPTVRVPAPRTTPPRPRRDDARHGGGHRPQLGLFADESGSD